VPKFRRGDFVKRRGESIRGEVEAWTFHVAMKEFRYWISGFGSAIPENELYRVWQR